MRQRGKQVLHGTKRTRPVSASKSRTFSAIPRPGVFPSGHYNGNSQRTLHTSRCIATPTKRVGGHYLRWHTARVVIRQKSATGVRSRGDLRRPALVLAVTLHNNNLATEVEWPGIRGIQITNFIYSYYPPSRPLSVEWVLLEIVHLTPTPTLVHMASRETSIGVVLSKQPRRTT